MSGIYVHIPFCQSRCVYCDFFSTTRLELRHRYVVALCRELDARRDYIAGPAHTIYIGGGTPSQLDADDLRLLFSHIDTSAAAEVTMECNPDDVTPELAATLSALPVNRVSMGAQTFNDERLTFLRRRHTARQVEQAVGLLRHAGIENISLDLMYGFPGETLNDWHTDIDSVLRLSPEHISAYALMYEEGTPLYRMLTQGIVDEADEELSIKMYSDLADRLREAGYEHYEISNFALPSFRSLHNSNYWNETPYLGVGAAAHSYNGSSRQWNVSDLEAYIEGMENGRVVAESEQLSDDTRYNERVMTALRTCEGLRLSRLTSQQHQYCLQQAAPFVDAGLLQLSDDRLVLSRKGLFVSNMVMSALMKVDD